MMDTRLRGKNWGGQKLCPPPLNPLPGGETVMTIAGDTPAPRQHKHAALAIKNFNTSIYPSQSD
jgi:hypothetical protein